MKTPEEKSAEYVQERYDMQMDFTGAWHLVEKDSTKIIDPLSRIEVANLDGYRRGIERVKGFLRDVQRITGKFENLILKEVSETAKQILSEDKC